jgi:hypothetical protein
MNTKPQSSTASHRSMFHSARRVLIIATTVVGVALGSAAVAQATNDSHCCLVVSGTVKVDKHGRAVGCRLDGANGTIKV